MRDEKNMQVAGLAEDAVAGRAPLPNLNVIVAVCDDWGIGIGGGMLVDNRADMRHFVRHTKGHTARPSRVSREDNRSRAAATSSSRETPNLRARASTSHIASTRPSPWSRTIPRSGSSVAE